MKQHMTANNLTLPFQHNNTNNKKHLKQRITNKDKQTSLQQRQPQQQITAETFA